MASGEELPAIEDEVDLVVHMRPDSERRSAMIHNYGCGCIYLTEIFGEVGPHHELPSLQRWVVPRQVFDQARHQQLIIGVNKGGFRSCHEFMITEIGLELARSQESVAK